MEQRFAVLLREGDPVAHHCAVCGREVAQPHRVLDDAEERGQHLLRGGFGFHRYGEELTLVWENYAASRARLKMVSR